MKKAVLSAVAVLLAVALSVGSAFALTPAYTKVAMPNPYGISTLSLDDNSTSRTLSSSGSFWFGKKGSATEIEAFTNLYDNFGSYVRFTESQTTDYTTFAYNIPAGTYFDFTSAVSYSTSDFQGLLVAGSVQFYLGFNHANSSLSASPDRAQFLINGLPVGDPVSISSGLFSFSSMEIDISGDVSTIGYRFFYDTTKTGNKDTSPYMSAGTDCLIWVSDDVSVTPLEVDDPYIPILTAILSWVETISSFVSPINPTLLRIENLLGELGGENGALARLASVFARDDDIQLRDDMDPVLQEATSIFYDSAENPDTAISSDTVSEAGETLKGMSSMFDSGYNATDAFQEIADSKDDFLSWFTEDTSNWLDTTVSIYSTEDDPYNHWMIENQYAEMERKRGGE